MQSCYFQIKTYKDKLALKEREHNNDTLTSADVPKPLCSAQKFTVADKSFVTVTKLYGVRNLRKKKLVPQVYIDRFKLKSE